MSIYDVLMAVLLVSLAVLMVVNHRTGWLATRMMDAPRRCERESPFDARRVLLDPEERPRELVRSSTSSPGD